VDIRPPSSSFVGSPKSPNKSEAKISWAGCVISVVANKGSVIAAAAKGAGVISAMPNGVVVVAVSVMEKKLASALVEICSVPATKELLIEINLSYDNYMLMIIM